MDSVLARKLQGYVRLSDADKLRLAEATSHTRQFDARSNIVLEGDDPHTVHVVLDGWVSRQKTFEDGRRQIVSFLLPGDFCDPHVFLMRRLDHSLVAVTPVTLALISGRAISDLAMRSPALAEAFQCESLTASAIQREWTASLGRRTAVERLAHLLCELHLRLFAVGLADRDSCPLPLTQADLADALGQTSVHINRTLQDLRGAGLVMLKGRRLDILDRPRLQRLAFFDPMYLQITMMEV